MTSESSAPVRRMWWTSAIALVAAAAIAVPVLWNFAFDPLRRATESGLYSNFFDHQAEAFLAGRLDVPRGALGLEGFIVDGREYLYFAPFPALLRVPVLAVTDAWFGELTTLSILIAWLVFAVSTCVLVWRVRRAVTPGAVLDRAASRWWGGLIVTVTAGSPVLILLATPWVYSEALMWATAGSVAVLATALGVLERPRARRLLALFVATLVAVLSRVTAAWPAALVVLLVALLNARRRPLGAMRWHVAATVATALIPLGVGVAFNVAKFGQPVSIPFEAQMWTGMSERRQQVLADGGVVGVRFLPATLVAYSRPDGLRVTTVFPFFSAPEEPPLDRAGQTLDMSYRTPSVPVAMPALVVVGVAGLVRVLRRGASEGSVSVRALALGSAAIPGGALLVGYIAPRYLVEFLPAVTTLAATGLAALLATRPRSIVRVARVGVVMLATLGLVVNAAIAVWSANVRHGVEPLQGLVRAQLQLAALPIVSAPPVEVGTEPPRASDPDTVYLLPRCEAAYYGTGDRYEPWAPIWMPRVTVTIVGGDGPDTWTTVDLVSLGGARRLVVDLDGDGSYRLRTVGTEGGYRRGPWRPLGSGGPDGAAPVTISGTSDWDTYLVESRGNLYTGAPSLEEYGDDVRRRPLPVHVAVDDDELREVDLEVEFDIEHPPLCEDLRTIARG